MESIDQRIRLNGRIAPPNPFADMQVGLGASNPRDPKTFVLTIKAPQSVGLKQIFDNAPTEVLYQIQQLIQDVISSRIDGKR